MDETKNSRIYYGHAHFMRMTVSERALAVPLGEGVTNLVYDRTDDEETTVETWRNHFGGSIVARLTTTWRTDGYVLQYERKS
jgi:hypothetical protein